MKKEYILKLGLAFTLLYAGIDSLLHPFDWIGFVPTWVNHFGITRELALRSHSFAEIILAILLLVGWKKPARTTGVVRSGGQIVATLIALDILVIILINGFGRSVFPVTFRDVGLLAVAIYLACPETKKTASGFFDC